MVSLIPVADSVSVFKTTEDPKERILFTLQIAVKQIQHYSSLQSFDDSQYFDLKEVHQLCDSLDKTLLHGLRCYQKGYWPFVKEFTHSNVISFLQDLDNVHTELQYGRAWLCLALTENSLESYFRSFHQNIYLVKKYYDSPALLRDEQRMQLVLMLMAGLEYVPIKLDIGKINYGCGMPMFGTLSYYEASNGSLIELPEYHSCSKVSQSSYDKPNDDMISCDNAVEVTGDFSGESSHSPIESKKPLLNLSTVLKPSNHEIDICNKVSKQDFERITHYINIDAENELAANEDLEVIRTKVVRRTKRSFCRKSVSDEKIGQLQNSDSHSPELKTQSFDESNNSVENRLSKATTDSGLCLETPCSSDSESPDLNDGLNQIESCHRTFFEIRDIQHDFDVTFFTPSRSSHEIMKTSTSSSKDEKPCYEERGAPEGQEDPVKHICISSDIQDRLPLLSGNDGNDKEVESEDEEISIYDISKITYFTDHGDSLVMHKKSTTCNAEDLIQGQEESVSKLNDEKPKMVDYVAEELANLLLDKPQDVDLRVDNNVLLYFIVEVYEHDEENFYKLYICFLTFTERMSEAVFVLLTNKGLYLLKPGNDQQKFFKCGSFRYSDIDYITVSLYYQSFQICMKNKQKFTLYTADEELTRTILSNLELGIRRFIPKLPLPAVYVDATIHTILLKRFLASQLECQTSEVMLQHYVLAMWEDSSSSPITPSGPVYQDFLMYRHKFANENKSTSWQPAFFLLKGGVLYCMEDEKNKPLFFIQMCAPHCTGCRRIHLLNRPHTFEIILSNYDSLQLAAADEHEASNWLQNFLQTVSLAGHFIDTDRNVQKPCSILLCNDMIIVAVESPCANEMKSLAKASFRDLVSIFTDTVATHLLILEFEVAEAMKSSGEWMLYFESEMEKNKFLECISHRWSSIFQVDLHVENVKDLYLRKKYRQVAEVINADKTRLREFCIDN